MFSSKSFSRTSFAFIAILFCFLLFKAKRFIDLNYTYDDIFSFLQMSFSWIDGRPLLAENVSYTNALNHNHYGVLVWFGLTYFWGAYGFFIQQVLLLTISYLYVSECVFPTISRQLQIGFTLTFLFGGIWFWINDHPSIGWSMELGYLPMSILFVVGYFYEKKALLVLVMIYTILIKEDGAVMCFSVHFICYGIKQFSEGQSIIGLFKQRNTWLITTFWIVVFALGMGFLSYKNSLLGSEARVNQAFTQLNLPFDVLVIKYLKSLFKLLLLLSPLVLFVCLMVQNSKATLKYRYYLLLSSMLAVVIAVISVQSLFHINESDYFFNFLGLLFPPRTIQPYSVLTAFCLAYIIYFGPKINISSSITNVLLGGFIVISQFVAVAYIVDFNVYTVAKNTVRGNSLVKAQTFAFSEQDASFLKILESQIPRHSDVFIMDFYIPIFHKHYVIWPSGKHHNDAVIAVIPKIDKQNLKSYLLKMNKQYDVLVLDKLNVYYIKSHKTYIDSALDSYRHR